MDEVIKSEELSLEKQEAEMKKKLEAALKSRVQLATEEINAVLKKHRLAFLPQPQSEFQEMGNGVWQQMHKVILRLVPAPDVPVGSNGVA